MRRGAMAEGGNDGDRNWSMWLRLLSHSVRDTAGSTSADDTTVLRAVCVDSFLIGVFTWFDTEYE